MEDINSELDRGSDRLDQATPEELLEFAHHYEQ